MKRKCVTFGANLANEDAMKIKIDDGSLETDPLLVFPDCSTKQMWERVFRQGKKNTRTKRESQEIRSS